MNTHSVCMLNVFARFLICHPSVWKVVTSLKMFNTFSAKISVCKFMTRATQHTCQCLHASRSRGVRAASERARRVCVYVGSSGKSRRWQRQHIERWLRSTFQIKTQRTVAVSTQSVPQWDDASVWPNTLAAVFCYSSSFLALYCTLVGVLCHRVALETGLS